MSYIAFGWLFCINVLQGDANSVRTNDGNEIKDNYEKKTIINQQNQKNAGKRKVGKIALEGQRRKQIKAM